MIAWFIHPVMVLCALGFFAAPLEAADREKLLSDPGVYVTFSAFKVDEDWWKMDEAARTSAAAVKQAFQKHAETVTADIYLTRGLSESADFFVRVHARDLIENQNFLLDLLATPLGASLKNVHAFNGITKKANYVPSLPEEWKTALKTPTDPGASRMQSSSPFGRMPNGGCWIRRRELRS